MVSWSIRQSTEVREWTKSKENENVKNAFQDPFSNWWGTVFFYYISNYVVLHNILLINEERAQSSSHRSAITQRFNYFKMTVGTRTPSATLLSAASAPGCPPASLTSSSATPWRSCPQSRPWLSSCASRHWVRGWGWLTVSSLPTIWCSWGTSGPGHTDRSTASFSQSRNIRHGHSTHTVTNVITSMDLDDILLTL